MNSLFYLQELKKSKWIKKRLYDANYQYCTLCRQFIMHNHHREINEPFIIKHMKKHRSNKIFKTTNLQTELKSEI
jgi:DNA-binding transcriptional regulator GbsR (MarR family)